MPLWGSRHDGHLVLRFYPSYHFSHRKDKRVVQALRIFLSAPILLGSLFGRRAWVGFLLRTHTTGREHDTILYPPPPQLSSTPPLPPRWVTRAEHSAENKTGFCLPPPIAISQLFRCHSFPHGLSQQADGIRFDQFEATVSVSTISSPKTSKYHRCERTREGKHETAKYLGHSF